MWVDEKGSFCSRADYGEHHALHPKERYMDVSSPEPTRPRAPGQNPFREWVNAIKESRPCEPMSNFDYAGRLTETVLLGVVALRAGGKIEWDAAAMRVRNNSDADQYLRRDYRKGFSIHV